MKKIKIQLRRPFIRNAYSLGVHVFIEGYFLIEFSLIVGSIVITWGHPGPQTGVRELWKKGAIG